MPQKKRKQLFYTFSVRALCRKYGVTDVRRIENKNFAFLTFTTIANATNAICEKTVLPARAHTYTRRYSRKHTQTHTNTHKHTHTHKQTHTKIYPINTPTPYRTLT